MKIKLSIGIFVSAMLASFAVGQDEAPQTNPAAPAAEEEEVVPMAPAETKDVTAQAQKSLLRVAITSQSYSFALPWQKDSPGTRRGLGALLAGNRVLVTAELAQDASYVELEIASSGKKLTAKVEAVDYEANLATLVPNEEPGDFFDGMQPLELETGCAIGEKLQVWQFENNGSAVSTDISFSRVDIGTYFLEDEAFLIYEATGSVQYRAGTFTLPVMCEGKLAGMLLSYSAKDQVAEILPSRIIARFLADAAEAPYDGFPSFGIKIAPTLDEQFRSWLKLDANIGGVYVSGVLPGGSAAKAGVLQGDVITEVSGFKIDSRGNYEDPDFGLLSMGHLVKGAVKVGDLVKLKVLREGALVDLEVKMQRRNPQDHLVDPYMFDRGPNYLILGGMLFQELTTPYLQLSGEDWRSRAPFLLNFARENPEKFLKEGRRKIVFLSGVIPSESTIGYERISGLIVDKVNGKFIADIKDLDEAVKSPIDGVHRIEVMEFPKVLHVDAQLAEEDNKTTMPQRYRITNLKRIN